MAPPPPRARPLAPLLCAHGTGGQAGRHRGGREQVPQRSLAPETLLPVAQALAPGCAPPSPAVLAPGDAAERLSPGGRAWRRHARLPGPGATEGTRMAIRGGLSGTGPDTIPGGGAGLGVRWPRGLYPGPRGGAKRGVTSVGAGCGAGSCSRPARPAQLSCASPQTPTGYPKVTQSFILLRSSACGPERTRMKSVVCSLSPALRAVWSPCSVSLAQGLLNVFLCFSFFRSCHMAPERLLPPMLCVMRVSPSTSTASSSLFPSTSGVDPPPRGQGPGSGLPWTRPEPVWLSGDTAGSAPPPHGRTHTRGPGGMPRGWS